MLELLSLGVLFVLCIIFMMGMSCCCPTKEQSTEDHENSGNALEYGSLEYRGYDSHATRTPIEKTEPSQPKRKQIKYQNLAFYGNEIKSRPDGDYIDNILIKWYGNYDLLERNHNYIQWLFPNRQPGVNAEATILTDEEARIIKDTPELKERVRKAFGMMLDFYGMTLTQNNKIQLSANHAERLQELNRWGNHNFLRITRILLALKEFGHEDLAFSWMKILANLIYYERILENAQISFENHWLGVLDPSHQIQLKEYLVQIKIL